MGDKELRDTRKTPLMRIADLPRADLARTLAGDGLRFACGPFQIRLRTRVRALIGALQALYADHAIAPDEGIDDYRVKLDWASWPRRWVRPVVRFSADGPAPFTDVPVGRGLATLEWGINWCIATRAHHLLMLHAAIVARDGQGLILPAHPGHGKSTLCAALAHSGWRLFSDEFGLVRPGDGQLVPLPRLISLKNESIEVIRAFAPAAYLGPPCDGTHKGTVAHVRPPADSVRRAAEPAAPRWLIFPRWRADAPLRITPVSKYDAFVRLATNAFNYQVLGATAYNLVSAIVRDCDCYALQYSRLPEAIAALDQLSGDPHAV